MRRMWYVHSKKTCTKIYDSFLRQVPWEVRVNSAMPPVVVNLRGFVRSTITVIVSMDNLKVRIYGKENSPIDQLNSIWLVPLELKATFIYSNSKKLPSTHLYFSVISDVKKFIILLLGVFTVFTILGLTILIYSCFIK